MFVQIHCIIYRTTKTHLQNYMLRQTTNYDGVLDMTIMENLGFTSHQVRMIMALNHRDLLEIICLLIKSALFNQSLYQGFVYLCSSASVWWVAAISWWQSLITPAEVDVPWPILHSTSMGVNSKWICNELFAAFPCNGDGKSARLRFKSVKFVTNFSRYIYQEDQARKQCFLASK